jgi:hypothetical protein
MMISAAKKSMSVPWVGDQHFREKAIVLLIHRCLLAARIRLSEHEESALPLPLSDSRPLYWLLSASPEPPDLLKIIKMRLLFGEGIGPCE